MKSTGTIAASMLAATIWLVGQSLAQEVTAPDNTKSNKTNPSNRVAVADNQKNDKEDLMLTQQIRKDVMSDKSLSTYAHNVKIVSSDGNVTLTGVVRSEAEKALVEAKAKAFVQQGRLTNHLTIAP